MIVAGLAPPRVSSWLTAVPPCAARQHAAAAANTATQPTSSRHTPAPCKGRALPHAPSPPLAAPPIPTHNAPCATPTPRAAARRGRAPYTERSAERLAAEHTHRRKAGAPPPPPTLPLPLSHTHSRGPVLPLPLLCTKTTLCCRRRYHRRPTDRLGRGDQDVNNTARGKEHHYALPRGDPPPDKKRDCGGGHARGPCVCVCRSAAASSSSLLLSSPVMMPSCQPPPPPPPPPSGRRKRRAFIEFDWVPSR